MHDLQDQVYNLGKQNAADGIEYESQQTDHHDQDGVKAYEGICAHAEGNGDSQKQRDQVRKACLRGIGKIIQNAAFPEEITEHQETNQGYGRGSDQSDDKGYDDGEQDPCGLGNRPCGLRGHADSALLLRGNKLDGEGLYDGHQRHVGISGNRDRSHVIGAEHLGNQNGGRAVSSADDTDGGSVLQIKSQESGGADREENAELSGGSEQEHNRLGKQRAEVNHGSDTDEQKDRHRLRGFDSHVEQPFDNAVYFADTGHGLVDHARQGKIDQNGAEAHRQKQRRLIFLPDGEIDEQSAYQVHDDLLRGNG